METAKTVHIFHAQISSSLGPGYTDWAEAHLNEVELKKIRAFKFKSDHDLAIVGKLITLRGLQALDCEIQNLKDLAYSKFKRPNLHHICDFDFNISHSGNTVVVAIAKGRDHRVGVDIQEYSEINVEEFTIFFDSEELTWIGKSKARFFELWTKKEALLKAQGKGFFQKPTSCNVIGSHIEIEGTKFFMKAIPFDDLSYKLSIALKGQKIEYVDSAINIVPSFDEFANSNFKNS